MRLGPETHIAPTPTSPRILAGTPRIVLLDDVLEARNCHKAFLGFWFKQADLFEFEEGHAAWAELSRADPDLLITDSTHPGLRCEEMLQRFVANQAKFPIIVCSAFVGHFPEVKQRLREMTSPHLKIYFLDKPLIAEVYREVLEAALGISLAPGAR